MQSVRDRARARSASALVVLAVVADITGVALFSDSAPYIGFLDLARAAAPGLAFAGAAVAVLLMARGGLGPLTLAVAAVLCSAPWLGAGLQQDSPGWAAIESLGTATAPALAVLASMHPDGRLGTRPQRVAASGLTALAILMVLVRIGAYDPAGWGWCRCVSNPAAVLDVTAAQFLQLADAFAVAQAGVVLVGLGVLVAVRPSGAVGWSFLAAYAAGTTPWLLDAWAHLGTTPSPSWVPVVRDATLVLLPILYAVSFAQQRPSRAHVADLLLAARAEHQPARLRELVARAIGDPRASVAWWDPDTGGFRDHLDRPVERPESWVLPVSAGGRPVALVVSDRIDGLEPGVRDSVAEALLLSSENRRLTAELQASLEQVRDSRERILTAGDETRRRIERDLHDGAQQLLISTGIKLNLAATQAGQGDAHALAEVLEEAQAELNRALAELRNLASGIAPTALVHGGLESALQELALHSPVPTSVRVSGGTAPDARAAATAYFVVAECLTNVVKHADAGRVSVEVTLGEELALTVADDGRGGARLDSPGTGLRGLVDRVEARGGRLGLASGPGGTTVTASVPAGDRAEP